jgi:2,5-diamino-6-(ribosylamino)-4(3H)-pyrimidinone 5'-phosphate reductase
MPAGRPHVICHMAPSIDGRIVVDRWRISDAVMREYERTGEALSADAWMIGRISMEPYAGKSKVPMRKGGSPIPRTDFIARRDAPSYAIALDPSGKLTWRSASIDDEHVVTVLSEAVSDDYLAFLQSKGVSYLFGGKTELNLRRVLAKLRRRLGIKRLLVEGGGKINGSFLSAGLIDELSLVVLPIADGSIGAPSLFDAKETRGPVRHLRLIACQKRRGSVVWLRYRVR